MKRFFALCTLACCLSAPFPGARADTAQDPVQVQCTVDRSVVFVGDPVRLSVRATAEPGVEVKMPAGGLDLGGMHLKDFSQAPVKTLPGNRTFYETAFVLESFVTGSYVVPSLSVLFRTQGRGEFQEVKTGQIFIEVRSVQSVQPGTSDDIRDIKPPVRLPWTPAALAGWLLAAALLAAYAIWRRRRRRVGIPEADVSRAPHETALEELESIQRLNLPGQGRVKEYFFRVSNTLRRYIENRFRMPVTEKTTEEFIGDLARSDRLASAQKELIRAYLTDCDRVKFARYEPTAEQTESVYRTAVDFIRATTPVLPDAAERPEP